MLVEVEHRRYFSHDIPDSWNFEFEFFNPNIFYSLSILAIIYQYQELSSDLNEIWNRIFEVIDFCQ